MLFKKNQLLMVLLMLIAYFYITFNIIKYTAIRNNYYNYYELAVQKWCSVDYNIHGLWPQKDSSHYPTHCSDVGYVSPTGSLLINMTTYWNSCNDNDSFWKHEWQKHGSCVNEQVGLNEYQYFSLAMELFRSNQDLLKKCVNINCIMACFDLNYNLIDCPNVLEQIIMLL